MGVLYLLCVQDRLECPVQDPAEDDGGRPEGGHRGQPRPPRLRGHGHDEPQGPPERGPRGGVRRVRRPPPAQHGHPWRLPLARLPGARLGQWSTASLCMITIHLLSIFSVISIYLMTTFCN